MTRRALELDGFVGGAASLTASFGGRVSAPCRVCLSLSTFLSAPTASTDQRWDARLLLAHGQDSDPSRKGTA